MIESTPTEKEHVEKIRNTNASPIVDNEIFFPSKEPTLNFAKVLLQY